jgi:hypothetical protein
MGKSRRLSVAFKRISETCIVYHFLNQKLNEVNVRAGLNLIARVVISGFSADLSRIKINQARGICAWHNA